MVTPLRVWGIGNCLLGDDGVGCRVVALLREGGMGEAVDCGTAPENLTGTLRVDPPRCLLIVDAAELGLHAGEQRLLTLDVLEGAGLTSHGLPLPLLLSPFLDRLEVLALGIQPLDCRVGAPLSPPIESAVTEVAARILDGSWRSIKSLHN